MLWIIFCAKYCDPKRCRKKRLVIMGL
ncbi:MAG: hypothetical protein ISS77_02560 [Phycisphaerae bacterium]|nr:hypothetical protein [Planctomycetota bacterium]MBL7106478.1 hypothetical protein [Phycisphaerae bacterium]